MEPDCGLLLAVHLLVEVRKSKILDLSQQTKRPVNRSNSSTHLSLYLD